MTQLYIKYYNSKYYHVLVVSVINKCEHLILLLILLSIITFCFLKDAAVLF